VVVNYPFAMATGLGINSFVALTIAPLMSWPQAMGLVLIKGLVVLALVAAGACQAVFNAVPAELKVAIATGIGLFICFIGFVDAGLVRRLPDAAATTSSSSNTVYIESAARIAEGARTGLACVVTGLLFLAAMFFTPLYSVVPIEAAAPALVAVGALMVRQAREIDFAEFTVALPAFLTIMVMPFT
jgi:xanthine/uracil/vitamin C permease (AzgA family)